MHKWLMAALLAGAFVFGLGALFSVVSQHSAVGNQDQAAHPQATPPVPDVTLDVQAAETIYKTSCIACHGNQLEGKVGPSLQKVGTRLALPQIYQRILHGGNGMPAFQQVLTDPEIANLAKWLEQHK